jgi:hypothetical protein
MSARIDEATATFLEAAADDLQRQAGLAGIVEGIAAETSDGAVALVATIRIRDDLFRVRGSGDSLLTAYASLTRAIPEAMLASAFRALVAS